MKLAIVACILCVAANAQTQRRVLPPGMTFANWGVKIVWSHTYCGALLEAALTMPSAHEVKNLPEEWRGAKYYFVAPIAGRQWVIDLWQAAPDKGKRIGDCIMFFNGNKNGKDVLKCQHWKEFRAWADTFPLTPDPPPDPIVGCEP